MAVRDVVQAAAGALGGDKLYVEDVFSTYLYTGNGSTQTITNGIDLAGEGGLVWQKMRSDVASHLLTDTVRGSGYALVSNSTGAQFYNASIVSSFNSNGFTDGGSQASGATYASWTFRKAPKFFDVVTYTGTGSAQNIAHNLGSAPGFLIVKPIDSTGGWTCWHRSLSNSQYMRLNTTAAVATDIGYWNNTAPTSTQFSVGSTSITNGSGITYVAYLFAHDAGGFGDDGEQNVVSCGSFTTDGSSFATVSLGWEPQFVLMKAASDAGNWVMLDTMRGWIGTDTSAFDNPLYSNLSASEDTGDYGHVTATGFRVNNMNPSTTCIYIAIRRGPMKTPESGTEVFTPQIYTGDGTSNRALTGFGFSPDLVIQQLRPGNTYDSAVADRLRGVNNTGSTIGTPMLRTNTTEAEGYSGATQCDIQLLNMDGITVGLNSFTWSNGSGYSNVLWNFRRAPGFFDEVCYTGTGAQNRAVPHNLTVTPELAIFKNRTTAGYNWVVKTTATWSTNSYLILEGNNSLLTHINYGATANASQLTLSTGGGNAGDWNRSGDNIVAYLFASVPGVSKCGSYTGTGTTQQINCGFTTGARFVLIKRTDSTGNWYVWDSARGIVSGNDPYLLLNSTVGEATTTDYIDPYSAGFEISSTAPAEINASGGSYIFMAIS